ncbi:MAG: cyclic nucleotide-binding domain-containing protein [Alphaproteobacteria bacterium]|jgi:CRP-like cAMP-binding protein|nr:cyclic nucleotide-binding domain-containing protein [Alphaproteobacteria bacterium]
MVTMGTAPSLDGVPLLASMPAEARERLARQCRWRRFAAHETIIDRSDDGRDVYFVVEGRVRVVDFSASGREISFDDLETGAFFGELAAIDGGPRSASIVAQTATRVAVMPPAVFADVAAEHPALALELLRHLAAMVRRSTERIMDLSTLAANNRVQAEILRRARKGQAEDGTAVIRPIPVHGDIAARVSTTRETVARVFGDLGRAGIVERQGDHLLVRDFGALQEMVEEVRGEL